VRFFVVQQDISRPARVISSVRVISRPARVISSDRVISRPARVISSDRVISRPARVISSDRVISRPARVISSDRGLSRAAPRLSLERPRCLEPPRVVMLSSYPASPLRMTRSAQDDSVRYETSHVARATVKCAMKTIMHPNLTDFLQRLSLCLKVCVTNKSTTYHHHASRIHGTPHRAIVSRIMQTSPEARRCTPAPLPTRRGRQLAATGRDIHLAAHLRCIAGRSDCAHRLGPLDARR